MYNSVPVPVCGWGVRPTRQAGQDERVEAVGTMFGLCRSRFCVASRIEGLEKSMLCQTLKHLEIGEEEECWNYN